MSKKLDKLYNEAVFVEDEYFQFFNFTKDEMRVVRDFFTKMLKLKKSEFDELIDRLND